MGKVKKTRCKLGIHGTRMTPYALPSCSKKSRKGCHSKEKHFNTSEKKDWEGATCPVCLEYPHNAVLLLCSSYNKGCRSYMCATSSRFSNCLKQYKKAYTKLTSVEGNQQLDRSIDNSSLGLGAGQGNEKIEVPELLCPLCRGQVKGWTVVEPARKYLNAKKRACMQNKCPFIGSYKQLKKHVRTKHPSARPRAVDPVLEEKWKKLECERERSDIISTVLSSTPGAIVLGDYVIEPGHHGVSDDDDGFDDSDDDDGVFPFGLYRGQSGARHQGQRSARFYGGSFRRDYSIDEDNYRGYRPMARLLVPRRPLRGGRGGGRG